MSTSSLFTKLKSDAKAGRLSRLDNLALRLSDILLNSDVRIRDFVISFILLSSDDTNVDNTLDTLLDLILSKAAKLNLESPKSGETFITELTVRVLALTEINK